MKLNKHLFRAASLLLTVMLLIFAFKYISSIAREINREEISVNWLALFLSAILFTSAYIFLSWHWLLCCRVIKKASLNRRQAWAFFASQPYKYMPTSLFTFSSRAVYAKKLGIGIKDSSLAQLLENASMLTANLVVFTIFLTASIEPLYGMLLASLTVLIAAFLKNRNELHVNFRRHKLLISPRQLAKMFAVVSVGWIAFGLAFVLLNLSLGLAINFPDLMAANTIAFSLGILAFFAPGGIGIREYVYTIFSVSSSAIIIWRVLSFILDFVLGFTAILIINRQKNPTSVTSDE